MSDNESASVQHDEDDIINVEDEASRKNRNRERNKEHARKTRLRKKEQLYALKQRVHELEEEGRVLKQRVEACNVASILIGLSTGEAAVAAASPNEASTCASATAQPTSFSETLSGGKRKRFLSLDGEESAPAPMELNIKGHITLVGGSGNSGKTQMNWKTGVYFDEEGRKMQLTSQELKALRRERNRMHAKMTRDRKKCFLASLNRVISKLEAQNQELRDLLVGSRQDKQQGSNRNKSNYSHHQALDERKPATIPNTFNHMPLHREGSESFVSHPNSQIVNNQPNMDDSSKPKATPKGNETVPPNLKESSAALMSISNSRIFTIG